MLHMIPEVRQQLSLVSDYLKVDSSFPMAELLVSAGIILMFVIEMAIQSYRERCMADVNGADSDDGDIPLNPSSTGNSPVCYGAAIPNQHSGDNLQDEPPPIKSHSRSFMFFIALCIHGVFVAFTIGLLQNSADVITLSTGMCLHEGPISFSFAATLKRDGLRSSVVVLLVCLHALTFPLGVGVGIALNNSAGRLGNLSSGIMQGLATGFLLYLAFFDMLQEAAKEKENRSWKTLLLIIGFAGIALLQLLP
ncbi:zinc transporter ZIP1-like [Ptychodera flava]|uniref:zinc transporter ZIP1-like n=1 Tax=Ptychodera flava TaxID=63121 RepID=UPI00396A9145